MRARLTLTLALLLLCTGAALAQTPDWMTPSEETICDGESGAAFGLCNAYCEAMDCDGPNAQASATACAKVKDKFTNITGRALLPCESCPPPPPGTTCPCVGALPDFDLTLSSPGFCEDLGLIAIKNVDFITGAVATCALNPPIGGGWGAIGPNGAWFLDITPEEGSACIQAILDSCNP